jgi:hypothetical protein
VWIRPKVWLKIWCQPKDGFETFHHIPLPPGKGRSFCLVLDSTVDSE